ncbi:exopolysaccharide Pel transporter PelG [Thermotoga sp. SG1]|uniref:exopolysaccharide Pel transporter PelG n=1 Tax=Thermotoga sp. SG1 TaxID=126739 RepID=UPI000C75E59F|nr:exopolysaccharide Pel transporter PelG [Thermotoga sp. SG1]PLV55726.1 hypothetical protein AS006_08820 [Thermotoga sp. SG1]
MAGKSFDLIFSKNTLFADALAFFYSIFIYFAPWLVVLFYIVWVSRWFSPSPFFLGVLTYSLIFSMIVSGGMSFLISRFLADSIYRKDFRRIYESYIGAVLFVFAVSFVIGWIFFVVNDQYSTVQKVLSCYALIGFSLVWIQMQFASVTERSSLIALSFILGFSISIFLARYWKTDFPEKLLLVLDVGIGLIIFALNYLVLSYLRNSTRVGFGFLTLTRKYPQLIFVGYFYYLSIWIDNFTIWKMKGQEISPGFFLFAEYDIPKFVAALFFIPSLAVFNIAIETVFRRDYKNLMISIVNNHPLKTIRENMMKLSISLKQAFLNMLSLNLAALVSCFFLAHSIKKWFNLSENFVDIFYWHSVGVSMNISFLSLLVVVLHFEYYGVALEGASLVLMLNALLSALTIERFPGFSFFISFSAGVVYLFLRFKSKDFLHEEYVKQPLGLEKSKIEVRRLGERKR